MRQPTDRTPFAKSPLLMASILLAAVVGCDQVENSSSRADRKVRSAADETVRKLSIHGNGTGAEARKLIEPSARDTDASASARAQANSLLAEADLATARESLGKLAHTQIKLNSLAWELQHLTESLANASALAVTYRELDPDANRQQAAAIKRSAQGSASETAWFKHDGNADVPTLAAVTQDISRIQGEINRRQQSIDQLNREQNELAQQADQAIRHADELKGDAGVSEFRRGTDLRKQAAGLSAQTQQLLYELSPLKNDLSLAEEQKKNLEAAVANIDQSSAQMDSSWQAVQGEISTQEDIAKAVLNGLAASADTKVPAQSIAAKAEEYNALLAQSQTDRATAEQLLTDVIESSNKAAMAGEALKREMGEQARQNPISKESYDALAAAHNPANYRLQQATAKHILATSYAAGAQALAMKQQVIDRLDPVLKAANLPMPAPLVDPELPSRLDEARQKTVAAFTDANESLGSITEGGMASADTRNSARMTRVLTLHAWARFEDQMGNAEGAATHLQLAKQETAQAVQDNGPLPPSLPAELRPETVAASQPAPAAPATPEAPAAPATPPAQ